MHLNRYCLRNLRHHEKVDIVDHALAQQSDGLS
jgi:hypothetical protein